MSEDYERDEEEEQSDSAEWLITFSDLTMLLLVFFIMLYAMSPPDPEGPQRPAGRHQALSARKASSQTPAPSRAKGGGAVGSGALNKRSRSPSQRSFPM
jgi:chemotaxis protein MotB